VACTIDFITKQVLCQVMLKESDVAVRLGCLHQGALNLTACDVCCMDNASVAVTALFGEVQTAI